MFNSSCNGEAADKLLAAIKISSSDMSSTLRSIGQQRSKLDPWFHEECSLYKNIALRYIRKFEKREFQNQMNIAQLTLNIAIIAHYCRKRMPISNKSARILRKLYMMKENSSGFSLGNITPFLHPFNRHNV